jgi:hypothetical protein
LKPSDFRKTNPELTDSELATKYALWKDLRIRGLENHLRKVIVFAEQLCEDVGVSKHQHCIELARQFLATNDPDSMGEREK